MSTAVPVWRTPSQRSAVVVPSEGLKRVYAPTTTRRTRMIGLKADFGMCRPMKAPPIAPTYAATAIGKAVRKSGFTRR